MSEEQPTETPPEGQEEEGETEPAAPPKKFHLGQFGYNYNEADDTDEIIRTMLWELWDHTSWTFWLGKAKPEVEEPMQSKSELQLVNQIGGYYRYLDKLGGKAFCCGVVLQHGETERKTIHLLWIFRGKRINREIKKETVCGEGLFHLYNWEKLNTREDATREMINSYLKWEEEIGEFEFLEGKVFT